MYKRQLIYCPGSIPSQVPFSYWGSVSCLRQYFRFHHLPALPTWYPVLHFPASENRFQKQTTSRFQRDVFCPEIYYPKIYDQKTESLLKLANSPLLSYFFSRLYNSFHPLFFYFPNISAHIKNGPMINPKRPLPALFDPRHFLRVHPFIRCV